MIINKEDLNLHWFWKYSLKKGNILEGNIASINIQIFKNIDVFYILFFVSILTNSFKLNEQLLNRPDSFLWPVFWAQYLPTIPWILIFNSVTLLLSFSAIFLNHKKIIRIFLFIFSFILFSFNNSFGKINHSLHNILIPLFFFIFISFKNKNDYKNSLIYYSAVFSLLSTYFFAGFWKILKGLFQIFEHENGIFTSNEMTRLIHLMYRYEPPSIFADFLLNHENIGFLSYWIAILIEFFAVFIFFKPKLNILWGVLILAMHIFIYATIGAYFIDAYLSVIPLLILNPTITAKLKHKDYLNKT